MSNQITKSDLEQGFIGVITTGKKLHINPLSDFHKGFDREDHIAAIMFYKSLDNMTPAMEVELTKKMNIHSGLADSAVKTYIEKSQEDLIEKGGGKRATIGEVRVWSGQKWVKHSDGWVHVNEKSGKATLEKPGGKREAAEQHHIDHHKEHLGRHGRETTPKEETAATPEKSDEPKTYSHTEESEYNSLKKESSRLVKENPRVSITRNGVEHIGEINSVTNSGESFSISLKLDDGSRKVINFSYNKENPTVKALKDTSKSDSETTPKETKTEVSSEKSVLEEGLKNWKEKLAKAKKEENKDDQVIAEKWVEHHESELKRLDGSSTHDKVKEELGKKEEKHPAHDELVKLIDDMSANNSSGKIRGSAFDEVMDSLDSDTPDYKKAIKLVEDFNANDQGRKISGLAVQKVLDKFSKTAASDSEKTVKEQYPIGSTITVGSFASSDTKTGEVIGYKQHEDKKDGYVVYKDSDGKEQRTVWSAIKKVDSVKSGQSPVELLNKKNKELTSIEEKLDDHHKGIKELEDGELKSLKDKKEILVQVVKNLEKKAKVSNKVTEDTKAKDAASQDAAA